ncbi:type II toxin-antitoxin system HicA family toxin [Mucilaginibacter segetis]|nr:type II toxin-antitoxin system HicA family toxin [Mucilaginibacter segetis]
MKIPRDVSASALIKELTSYGYVISRQKGSHIRLTLISEKGEHHLTVPNHNPLKLGTLVSILNDASANLGISKEQLINKL